MWVQPFRPADVEVHPPRERAEPKVAVLVNGNARRVTPKVIRALSHVVGEGDLFVSRSELDARRIAQQVVDRRYGTVFLGGGDGTLACFVNEIANQVQQRRAHHPTAMPRFGVLKLGTGNSVAEVVNASPVRGDGIVDDVLRARAGEVPGYRTVDLLSVEGRVSPFCGLGVDGKILNDYVWVKENLAQGPLSRVMTGAGGYFASVALKTLPHYLANASAVECEVVNGQDGVAYRMGRDGKPVGEPVAKGATLFRGPVMMACAGTVPFYGYALKMFPFAGKRRGMMNLRLATIPALDVVANLAGLWKGTWFPEGMHDFLTQSATVRFARPMDFQIAGDAHGQRDEVTLGVSREPIELLDFTGALH